MDNYPEVVAKIANDYLERVKSQLRLVPAREQNEFLRELQSHLYEAYQQTPGEDDVARILAVLRNIGEPAEVVSDGLPGAMVRAGTRRSLPLYVLGGIVIALFGLPLGFSGVAVLGGILATLVAMAVAYCTAMGVVFFGGALFMFLGLTRLYKPGMWDKLIALGVIQMDGRDAAFFDQVPPVAQGLLFVLIACLFIATGLGMLKLGRYLSRGLRFLYGLAFEWVRQSVQSARRKLHHAKREGLPVSQVSFVK